MKSIVEEASSISKAIEQAWNRAGKPASFSIKIFEEPKRNMFGITVQSAKIGLFFEGRIPTPARDTYTQKPFFKKEPPPQAAQRPVQKPRPVAWQPDMVEFAKEWIAHVLNLMGLPDLQFAVSTSGNTIKFQFQNYVTGKEAKDRLLFSSFAHLVMTALRQKYKRALPHLKIVLTSG